MDEGMAASPASPAAPAAPEATRLREGDPPLTVGEAVTLAADGRAGHITRAYPMEDKYTVTFAGDLGELRRPDNGFLYHRKVDLARVALLAPEPPAGAEDGAAQTDWAFGGGPGAAGAAAVAEEEAAAPAEPEAPRLAPGRYQGRVKWWVRDKGFGKIQPLLKGASGEPVDLGDSAEDVFLHRNQMRGGGDGPHASSLGEGVVVTYGLTTHDDGKPCACDGEVPEVTMASSGGNEAVVYKAKLVRKLLAEGMHTGTFQVRGVGKANMEDRFIVKKGTPVDTIGSACKKCICSIFGVFDGHSGASCSDFVANNLDRSIFDSLRLRQDASSDLAVRNALLAAFRMTEHKYMQYLNKLEGGAATAWASAGSTACSAMFYGPDEEGRLRLAVANAGDSRVVMGRRDGTAVRLSEDHTPEVPGERKRIEQEGAAVVQAHAGIWRIVLPSKRGLGIAGLSVSRGFGDLEYKQPANVVSAVPDVALQVVDLREECFVVFASDGVWGPVTDADAVRIVAASLREAPEGGDPAAYAARQLVEEAHRRDGNDDKTAVIVWFGDMPSAAPLIPSAPTLTSANRLQPRQVLQSAARSRGQGDDMFAVKRPMSAPQQQAGPQPQDADLDNLFSTYARDMGVR